MLGTSRAFTADEIGAGRTVLDHERISTFIRTSRHIDKKTGCVRPEAFTPRRFNSRLEYSVYRTRGLGEAEVWEICRKYYEEPANLTARGRGDGLARHVLAAGLSFDPNGVPHPRHADVIGWRDEGEAADRQLAKPKSHWMITAQRFAGEFGFVPKSEG